VEAAIRDFFAAYEKRFNESLNPAARPDVRGTTGAFADYFVGSSPRGVRGGKNGWFFRMTVPRGVRHYRRVGTRSMRIAALDISPLDALHAMAKVHWDSRYRRSKDGQEIAIEFDVFYFLTLQSGAPRIFAFVTGDEEKALREHGLL
jgi:hypothetical protein